MPRPTRRGPQPTTSSPAHLQRLSSPAAPLALSPQQRTQSTGSTGSSADFGTAQTQGALSASSTGSFATPTQLASPGARGSPLQGQQQWVPAELPPALPDFADGRVARALHPFTAAWWPAGEWDAERDLAMEAGELIVATGHSDTDDGWLQGYILGRKRDRGQFPGTADFVYFLSDAEQRVALKAEEGAAARRVWEHAQREEERQRIGLARGGGGDSGAAAGGILFGCCGAPGIGEDGRHGADEWL
jgi:hypothetical protein